MEALMTMKPTTVTGLSIFALALAGGLAFAAGQYGPGASDTEIKIGNTMPYSGPASAYGTIGKAEAAYFAMINEQGGINGRKINFISRDDGYSPPKTVEDGAQAGRGRPGAVAVQYARHAAQHRDPRLSERQQGAAIVRRHRRRQVERPEALSLDHGLAAQLPDRGAHLRPLHPQEHPDAKIAVLYQNDDFGKDYLIGLREGLGDKADKMIVATQSYETTDPTVDSQIVSAAGERRQRLADGGHPEIRRAGDPQGLRHRLEADAHPQQRVELGRRGDAAGGARKGRRHHLGDLRQGSDRSAVAGRRPNTRNGWRG